MTETIPRETAAHPDRPTIWGLSPVQVHDRFWAARGVQVVRQGERSEIVKGAELFLLTSPDTLAVFKLRELVETLSWLDPRVLVLRISDGRDPGFRERVLSDEEGGFLRFERIYAGSDSRRARVALTPHPHVARWWQNAESPREGWRLLRRKIPPVARAVRTLPGFVFDGSDDREVMACLSFLVDRWKRPDATVDRVRRAKGRVWADREATVMDGARLLGPVWVGAGRKVASDLVVAGPAVLWDDPGARPALPEVHWQDIEPVSLIRAVSPPPRPHPLRRFVKRVFDVLFSSLVLALTLPLYPFIALAIVIEDGWPVFYAHRRETLGGRVFPCLKFRSMRRDADRTKAELKAENRADGPQFYVKDDPRITRVGRFLRKTQLDEIPQFWNVLLGHMSVVGPRPSPFTENQFCPGWREARLSVRPGITGLWQVMRTRAAGQDFQEWIRYDLEYVERSGLRLDLWIIWRTMAILITGRAGG